MQISPLIAVHMSAALGALVLGPEAIWARKGATQRPRLHRAFGYGFATLMLAAAISSAFIGDCGLLNMHGFIPVHLLRPIILLGLFSGFHALRAQTSALIAPPLLGDTTIYAPAQLAIAVFPYP
jgi:uncharacterized membrane protein